MLAGVARGLVAAGTLAGELEGIGERVAAALGAAGARVELASAPSPVEGERAHRLPLADRAAWLYVREGREDPERVAEPLARLLDVALERERVAAQAAEADASRRGDVAKTAVLHAISHDLRSPLTAITTAADALAGEALADPDRDELVTVVREESARLARLIDDLLELSRIQAGAVHPRPDWCDLREVAARAVANVRVQRPDHAVEMLLPEDLPLVRADSAQLERVLTNLVENAAKFSPDDRAVAIRGGVGGGRVTVRVIDGGPGIPAAQRPQVFEPFFRGRPSEGGAGLGLAISRGFVEANGGTIAVQSLPGQGTSFVVSLPIEQEPAIAVPT
jgi:two-component system sensor histidine kinase KdpD